MPGRGVDGSFGLKGLVVAALVLGFAVDFGDGLADCCVGVDVGIADIDGALERTGIRNCSIPFRIIEPPISTPPKTINDPKISVAYGDIKMVTKPTRPDHTLIMNPMTPVPARNSPIRATIFGDLGLSGGGDAIPQRAWRLTGPSPR